MAHYVLEASSWIQDAITGFNALMKQRAIRKEKRAAFKRTVNELSRLTDFELNDLGICRGDIYNIARGDNTLRRGAETNKNLGGWV